MARDNNTWSSVMGSQLMTDPLRAIYYNMWSSAGLTKGEITAVLERANVPSGDMAWPKQIALLAKMGLLAKAGKRHCTAKNKEDTVWALTDLAEPKKPVANKPSAKKYQKAIEQFEMIIMHHTTKGDGLITPELRQLFEWCRDKVK